MKRYKQWILMDNFRRKIFIKYELKKRILKSIIKNDNLPFTLRYYAYYSQSKLTRFAVSSKHNNRCVRTGRLHGVIQKTQYSRFVIRRESHDGNIPGCRRASW